MQALLVQLAPLGPWRNGTATGARDRVDPRMPSDTLYSALCHAMAALGWIDEWLDATAKAKTSAVKLSSLFPWFGDNLCVPPPRHLWARAGSVKLRASAARFVPVKLLASLAASSNIAAENWEIDAASQCLIPRGSGAAPFRVALRSRAAVDRVAQSSTEVHRTACLEFHEGENRGYWCLAAFEADSAAQTWRPRLEAAFGWLADSGLGGERTSGWGQSKLVAARGGTVEDLLFGGAGISGDGGAWWMLSLYSPADSDSVDWTGGDYAATDRGALGPPMIAEGSVLVAARRPEGKITATQPAGGGHPVYRSGLALALPVPLARGPA
jgi:CRISPR type III-A-associated RAMP protein Csm4